MKSVPLPASSRTPATLPPAFLAPEEARLRVRVAQAARHQRHERRRGARPLLVQEARKGLAPAARLADQQHRGRDWRRSAAARRAAAASRGSCRPGRSSGAPSSLPDWRWRRPASSARSTVRSSLASDSGFSTKSKAPRRVASTAVSTVPWPGHHHHRAAVGAPATTRAAA